MEELRDGFVSIAPADSALDITVVGQQTKGALFAAAMNPIYTPLLMSS